MNLIIGGSSGLGNSLANCFAEDGKTIIVSRRNAKNTKENIVHIGLDINTDNLGRSRSRSDLRLSRF